MNVWKRGMVAGLAVWLLAACSHWPSTPVSPGASLGALEARLGPPGWQRALPEGGEQRAYPRGPAGFETWMAWVGPAGDIVRVDNVLRPAYFAQLKPGMTQDEVLAVLGPPVAPWTVTFESRHELAWEWRYCDDWQRPARFNALFDTRTGLLTGTLALSERPRFGWQRGVCSTVHRFPPP